MPVLTYTYTGLVNGDTSATFSGGLATTATSSSSVGGYPITRGDTGCDRQLHDRHVQPGHADGERGTLTITANNDSKTYGTLKTFSGTAFTETGLVTANGDTITGVTETSTGAAVVGDGRDLQHRSQRRDGHWAEQLHHRLRQRHADRQPGDVDHHGQQ